MVHQQISHSLLVIVFMLLSSNLVYAQNDLDDLLNDLTEEVQTINYTIGTFKSPRVINGHSIEMIAAGAMEFRISHRFGRLNSGGYNLWGLDQSTIRFGFDFGIFDWLSTGVGRSSYEKTYDGFIKFRLLRQVDNPEGPKGHLGMSWVSGMIIRGQDFPDPRYADFFSNRLSYYHMLLIAKKLNPRISLQFTGALTMQNFVESNLDANLRGALGMAGRFKLNNRIAITSEYFFRVPFSTSDFADSYNNYSDSFSVGFDIETGGHVFQLHFTNSLPMMERGFINETTGKWGDGDIHFGFNITREFTLRSNN